MKRHSSPYTIPALLLLAGLLTARLAHAEEAAPTPPPEAPAAQASAKSDKNDDSRWAEEKTEPSEISQVTLKDGQTLRGRVVERGDDSTTLELTTGGRVTLPASGIQSVTVEKAVVKDGKVWLADRNRTRYLYAPSAMMLKQGEGYFSQKELLFSSASVGVTDNLSVLVGAITPLWAAGANGFNFIFAAKAGFSVSDNFHLAAGVETLVLPGLGAGTGIPGAGFAFATATVGNPMAHASLSAGVPFAFSGDPAVQSQLGQLIVVASGNARLAQNFALVTENWIFPTLHFGNEPFLMLNALSTRFLLDRWTLDVGAIRIPGSTIPLPWIDVAYNWG